MFDEDGNKKDGVHLTRFYTGIKQRACYQVNTHENLAFGLDVAHLMMALNFIKLDNMPWDLILILQRCQIKKKEIGLCNLSKLIKAVELVRMQYLR